MSAASGHGPRVRSSLVNASVFHCRMTPRKHAFAYPMVTLQLDLDELESGANNSFLFGYNSRRLLSVRPSDYLRGEGALRQKVERELRPQGLVEPPHRITLVTMPRLCGYIFNPVSFFLCFESQGALVACVTEVHNTFGEVHIYPLVCAAQKLPVEWRFQKSFFVSPFFDAEGEYRVAVLDEGSDLHVEVDLFKSGSQVFASSLQGSPIALTTPNIIKTLIRFPLALLLTMPRIHFQALMLFLRARVTPVTKPDPISPYTIRSQQNIIHKFRLWLLSQMRRMRQKSDQ
jgi:DUF1365 family protein